MSNFSIELLLSPSSSSNTSSSPSSSTNLSSSSTVAATPLCSLSLANYDTFLLAMACHNTYHAWPSICSASSPSSTRRHIDRNAKAVDYSPAASSPWRGLASMFVPTSVNTTGFKCKYEPIQHKQLQQQTANRKRRQRTVFSSEQLQMLEMGFRLTPYPDVSMRDRLAQRCALRIERVEAPNYWWIVGHCCAFCLIVGTGLVQEQTGQGTQRDEWESNSN